MSSSSGDATSPSSSLANKSDAKDKNEDRAATDDLADALGALSIQRTDDKALSPATTKNLQKIADWIEESKAILVLTGAGVSVSAGIPDFRTPKTGLYDNLQKYNLPYAEAVFDIDFFRKNPDPFVHLASEIWPATDRYFPTLAHAFVKVLHDKKKLRRIYTQNIDGLERAVGVAEDSLIECHGHFRSGRCIRCKTKVADMEEVKKSILIERKVPMCQVCQTGYVKPDIVFFGEQLPDIFETTLTTDLPKADMLLVMGTSLQVPPVANIPNWVKCKRRVLLNRERVGSFKKKDDLFHGGNCDDSVLALAKILGWEDDLLEAHRLGRPVSGTVDVVDNVVAGTINDSGADQGIEDSNRTKQEE